MSATLQPLIASAESDADLLYSSADALPESWLNEPAFTGADGLVDAPLPETADE